MSDFSVLTRTGLFFSSEITIGSPLPAPAAFNQILSVIRLFLGWLNLISLRGFQKNGTRIVSFLG